jgi:hypothetical protein
VTTTSFLSSQTVQDCLDGFQLPPEIPDLSFNGARIAACRANVVELLQVLIKTALKATPRSFQGTSTVFRQLPFK